MNMTLHEAIKFGELEEKLEQMVGDGWEIKEIEKKEDDWQLTFYKPHEPQMIEFSQSIIDKMKEFKEEE